MGGSVRARRKVEGWRGTRAPRVRMRVGCQEREGSLVLIKPGDYVYSAESSLDPGKGVRTKATLQAPTSGIQKKREDETRTKTETTPSSRNS